MKHIFLTLLMVIAAATEAFGQSGNAVKYMLGGTLINPPAWDYTANPDYLFDYDEATGVWTKTIDVGTTATKYFIIIDSSKQEWGYSTYLVEGDHPAEELEKNPTGNMQLKVSGVYPGITFTITEKGGVPYMSISGFESKEDNPGQNPAQPGWFIHGSFTNDKSVGMQASSAVGVYTYKGSVALGDTFYIEGGADDLRYGASAASTTLSTDTTLTLQEGGAALGFDSAYLDAVFTWNVNTKTLSFSGTAQAPAYGTLKPTATSPDFGAAVTPIEPISKLTFTYSAPNGIDAIFRAEDKNLVLLKDGETYQVIPTMDAEAVLINRNYSDRLEIHINPITAAGNYSITLPQDLIEISSMTGGTLGTDSDSAEEITDPAKLRNAQYTLSFSVKDIIPFSISTTPGEVTIEDLQKLIITYPEGTVVSSNPSFNAIINYPAIYYINEVPETLEDGSIDTSNRSTLRSHYSVSYSGNKVILTADNPSAITSEANYAALRYYSVVIPAGMWQATLGGKTETMPAATYQPYTIKMVLDESEVVSVTPAPAKLTADNFQTITVAWPESYKFNEWTESNPMGKRVNYIVGYLRKVSDLTAVEGENYGSYKLTGIDTEARTLTLEFSENATALPAGYYCIMLTTNMFVLPNNTRNGYIYFPGFNLGVDTSGVTEVEAIDEFDVYSLQGVCIAKGVNSLDGLTPGMYIVNGKKVAFRKL